MPRQAFTGGAALASVTFGTVVSVVSMFVWDQDEYYFARSPEPASSVLSFYVAESIAIFLLLLGFYLAYGYARSAYERSGLSSSIGVIGSALSDRALGRVALAGGFLYGALYALASSIVVYQPTVDFAAYYGTTGSASLGSVPCCGTMGTLPEAIVYFSPQHLAIQFVPLSLLLLFIVPPLVGLNLAIAMFSVRRTVSKVTGRWMVACGAAVGLFTACPTCAGVFLAESVGGIGAATLAVALAPFQLVFIGVSIPLLVVMPFVFARRVRKVGVPMFAARYSATVEGNAEAPLAGPNR
jgi:hypothetical protein